VRAQFHSGRYSDEVACEQKDKGASLNRITFSAVSSSRAIQLTISFCYQAHDIIVVELAPPPPREANEESVPALDADAAVAAAPKVAEKKKVQQQCVQFVVRQSSVNSRIQEPESHSTLHIKKEHERDYMGRSWLEAIPADLRFCIFALPIDSFFPVS
jgi:hypothetical protein